MDYQWRALSPSWSNALYWVQPVGGQAMLLRMHTPGVLSHARRQQEMAIWHRAAIEGIAPKLLYVASDGAYCLTEWLEGGHQVMSHLVDMMQQHLLQFHQCLQPQDEPLDYQASVQTLINQWQQPRTSRDLMQIDRVMEAAHVLSQTQTPPVLCHLDLNKRNLLWGKQHCWLLDFEYAACAHPILDVVQLVEQPLLQPVAMELVAWYEQRGYAMQSLWDSASVFHRGLTWLWYEVEAHRRQDPLYQQQANQYKTN